MVKLYEFDKYDKVVAVGDIHGDFKTLVYKINNRGINNSIIIVCGDCGFGFHKFENYQIELTKLSKKLEEYNNCILFFRGNHDDPLYFENELINFSNIKTIPDYSVIKACDLYVLCVGGGISIDRKWRLQQEIIINLHNPNKETHKKLYWENEQIVYDENKLQEIADAKLPINVVCTHSAPSFCPPTDKNNIQAWLIQDSDLEKDLFEERNNLDKLYDFCSRHFKINKWAYGHFHTLSYYGDTKSKHENTEFQLMTMLSSHGYDLHTWVLNKNSFLKGVEIALDRNQIGAYDAAAN